MKNFNAVCHIYPDAIFSMVDDDLNKITWVGKEYDIPTQAEVDAKIAEIEAADAQAVTDKAAALASAESKLAALGLTAAEVSALLSK
jgi:ethanolamine ammonia-lyase large subunit